MNVCVHQGCLKPFNDMNEPCVYHPGAPLFHEGLKSWSCCSKKVSDFDEFLKIPGCTIGIHSLEKPKIIETKAPILESTLIDGKEHYGLKQETPVKQEIIKEEKIQEKDVNDPENAVIHEGTRCKRPGCKQSYHSSNTSECIFHNGQPVFHEGSKGWSCCSRKVLEFDEFLKIPGCQKGRHRYLDSVKKECRHDFYQTPTSVIVSVYAKMTQKTNVQFTENGMNIHIDFKDGSVFDWNTPLFQPIIPNECSYQVLSTKIEIILKKANGLSWADICPVDNVTSWTTFGTTGTVGTVGSKEAIIAQDAPIHLFK